MEFWRRRHQLEEDISVSPSGALTVATVTFYDRGVYMCNVSNIHGWEAASAVLTVQGGLR